MIEAMKQILQLLFKSNKIYLIPLLLLLIIIVLLIVSASISPVPIFMYPII